jgi:hypothetical protein
VQEPGEEANDTNRADDVTEADTSRDGRATDDEGVRVGDVGVEEAVDERDRDRAEQGRSAATDDV